MTDNEKDIKTAEEIINDEIYGKEGMRGPWVSLAKSFAKEFVKVRKEGVVKGKKQNDWTFYSGAIWALAVLRGHNEDTIYDEIVETMGRADLAEAVLKMGPGTSRWCGWDLYLKRNRKKDI